LKRITFFWLCLLSLCTSQPSQIRVCDEVQTGADYFHVNEIDCNRFHVYAPGCISELSVCLNSLNQDELHPTGHWLFGYKSLHLDLSGIGTLEGVMPGLSIRSFTPDGTILFGPGEGPVTSLWDIRSMGWDGFYVLIEYNQNLHGPLSIPVSCTIRYPNPIYDSNGLFDHFEIVEIDYYCGEIHVPEQVANTLPPPPEGPKKLPDLIPSLILDPKPLDNPIQTSYPTWKVTIDNVGTIDSGPFHVSLFVAESMEPWNRNNQVYYEKSRISIDNISPQQSKMIVFRENMKKPTWWLINVIVDKDNEVVERPPNGELNNELEGKNVYGWYETPKREYFSWPIPGSENRISSVLNEPRFSVTQTGSVYGRFHSGTDFLGPIFPHGYERIIGMSSGIIKSNIKRKKRDNDEIWDSKIETDNFSYYHLGDITKYEVFDNRKNGRWIISHDDTISNLVTAFYHVHVEESPNGKEYKVNSLRPNGVYPQYTNNNEPISVTPHIYLIRNVGIQYNNISILDNGDITGKFDIVIKVMGKSSVGKRVGIYSYRYVIIQNRTGNTIYQTNWVNIGEISLDNSYYHGIYTGFYSTCSLPAERCAPYEMIISNKISHGDVTGKRDYIVLDNYHDADQIKAVFGPGLYTIKVFVNGIDGTSNGTMLPTITFNIN